MTPATFSRAAVDVTRRLAPALIPIGLALLVTLALLLVVGAPPLDVVAGMWDGAFGNADRQADVLAACVPLTLAAVGLLVTFTAGLWNIGIEGQLTLGAIGATFVVRLFPDLPAPLLLPLVMVGAGLRVCVTVVPWKQPGRATASGTDPFALTACLPTLDPLRVSPWAVGIA